MKKLGIDVSEHNGEMNWHNITADFAIIRGGFGSGDIDSEFLRNAKNCTIPFGVYWFSYAYSIERAQMEATAVCSLLKRVGAKPVLPIFFDWEYDSDRYAKQNGVTVDSALYSDMAVAFMEKIRETGYKPGIYYNHDYYKNYCTEVVLDGKKYAQWYAYYGDICGVDCDIWQYTASGSLNSFEGDLNELCSESLLLPQSFPEKNPAQGKCRVLQIGKAQITNPFGDGHGGIDVVKATNERDSITAHSAGTVVFCQSGISNDQGSEGNRSYGNCVKLKHAGGYSTLYAHLDSVNVEYGDEVELGEKIGFMGNTGNSYGAHLHFEVRDRYDDRVDPERYLTDDLPGEKQTSSNYVAGTYEVIAEVLTVREGPGIDFDWISYGDLTDNAQYQIASICGGSPNGYVKGIVCDVDTIDENWGRTPSGWICLDYCERT